MTYEQKFYAEHRKEGERLTAIWTERRNAFEKQLSHVLSMRILPMKVERQNLNALLALSDNQTLRAKIISIEKDLVKARLERDKIWKQCVFAHTCLKYVRQQ